MKKRIAVLIGALIIGLTACGGSNSATGSDNVAGKPAGNASATQTDSSNNAESGYSSYEDIYDAYAKKLTDATPGLIDEYKTEAASNDKGVVGLAEISNSKVTKLAEISTRGTEEMASFMIKNDAGNSDKYQEWAEKLTQVYQSEAQKITDVYMQSVTGETVNTESARDKSESSEAEVAPTETPIPDVPSESSEVTSKTEKNNKEISLQDFYNDFCAHGSVENIADIADKYGLYIGSYEDSSKTKSYKIAYNQETAKINNKNDLNSDGNYIIVLFNTIDDSIYSVSFHTDSFDESNKKDHYDLTKGGRGDSYISRDEPNYIGLIGYAAIYVDQALEIEKTDHFQDMDLWMIPTYEPDKQFWNETEVKIPHKTEIVVREQVLEHEGYGNYSGYLLVEKTEDGSQYYINVSNFTTKPYWTYQSALRTAAIEGDLIAEYHQSSDYYPVDSGGEKLEIPEGSIVLVTGVSGMAKDINEDETGITAIVWKEWRKGYGGVECHFNTKDLQIIY